MSPFIASAAPAADTHHTAPPTTAVTVVDPKAEANAAPAPNAVFSPSAQLSLLTVVFLLASAVMVWLIIRAGKGATYDS